MDKPYLVCEYNGHMFPTKAFDNENIGKNMPSHRVLDAINEQEDIAGSFDGVCLI